MRLPARDPASRRLERGGIRTCPGATSSCAVSAAAAAGILCSLSACVLGGAGKRWTALCFASRLAAVLQNEEAPVPGPQVPSGRPHTALNPLPLLFPKSPCDFTVCPREKRSRHSCPGDVQLSHVACFGQWNMGRCDGEPRLSPALRSTVFVLTTVKRRAGSG